MSAQIGSALIYGLSHTWQKIQSLPKFAGGYLSKNKGMRLAAKLPLGDSYIRSPTFLKFITRAVNRFTRIALVQLRSNPCKTLMLAYARILMLTL